MVAVDWEKKATKGSRGGAQPTRLIFGLQYQQQKNTALREKEKKNHTTHAMNYLIAACSKFARGSALCLSFPCAARAGSASALPERAAAEMPLAVTRSACSTGVAHTFLGISNINESALAVNSQRVACKPEAG